MIGVPFYHRFSQCGAPQPAACKIWGFFFSKFLYVRDFPEYPYNIAQIQANTIRVLRSRKTYSRYLKKIPPSENLSLFGPTQYDKIRDSAGTKFTYVLTLDPTKSEFTVR